MVQALNQCLTIRDQDETYSGGQIIPHRLLQVSCFVLAAAGAGHFRDRPLDWLDLGVPTYSQP